MSTNTNPEEFYKKLKSQLEDMTVFPSLYLYKFIVPTMDNDNKVKEVSDKFNNIGATIKTKKSKNGKYTSLSIEVKMKSADAIINKYKEVTVIEGIISL
jgi:putative lipoic acid-binding regulatory protein